MFVAWREKHEHKKGANVPRFPLLVVWSGKCVSGGFFEGPEAPQKRVLAAFLQCFIAFHTKATFLI